MSIVQGDHGYAIPFITRKDIILDLTGASVEVAIERGGEIINKQANILDPLTGKCEVVLSSKDLRLIGKYTYQWTAFLADGRILSGDPINFLVKDKLRDLPFGDGEETKVVPFASQEDLDELKEYVDGIVITGGGSVVTDGDTNGAIKVNNVEVIVYDESGILQRIQALEEAPSGGSGSAVTDSAINGNIRVDGNEIKVYDDTSINEQLADMVRSVNGTLPDANGNVTIEAVGGTGADGASAYEVAVANGFVGTEAQWLGSLKGEKGDPGTGSGILTFNTVTDLQTAYPDGHTVPVWIISENAWYYWDGTATETPTEPTNTAPSISSSFNLITADDSTNISIPYNVLDSEGGTMTVTLTKDGVATNQTVSTGSNTWNVGVLAVGSHVLKIKVTDSGGLASSELMFNIEITETVAPETNTAPSIMSSYSTASVNDTTAISIPYDVTDVEGGSLTATYIIDGTPSTATIATGANTCDVGTLAVGSHTLTIQVADSGGLTSNKLTFNIEVTASEPVNGDFVTDGLQVYYDFTALTETPTTITDSSGNGNDGTLYGYAGTTESGINNGELIGDGNGDYIQIPHKSTLKTYPFTVEFYARFRERTDHISPPTQERLFDNRYGNGTGNGVNVYFTTPAHTNPNKVGIDGTFGQPNYTSNLNVWDNVHRHIVITWGASAQKIYVDGQLLATNSQNSTSPLGDRLITLFAAGNTSGDALAHACKLFRFYKKELTLSEITQNYNSVSA